MVNGQTMPPDWAVGHSSQTVRMNWWVAALIAGVLQMLSAVVCH